MIDKLEIGGVTIAAIALLGWSGYSIANTFIPQPETPVYEVNVDSVSDYMDNLDAEVEEAEATPTPTPTATPEPTSTPAPTKEPTKTPAPTKMPKKKVKKEEKKAEPTPAEAAAETPAAETPETPETPAPETPAAATPAAETPAPETPAAETPAPAATYATNDTVNFRTSPDKSSTVIGMIGKDVQLTVLEDQTSHPGWYKISRNGTEGYVSADFVTTK
ncbi:SH3 domain-containing protein [Ruminococcus sp. AF14-5]|nr:SH3 domain-containing protein [Ruminococcus sp. AF14-5]